MVECRIANFISKANMFVGLFFVLQPLITIPSPLQSDQIIFISENHISLGLEWFALSHTPFQRSQHLQ